MYTANANDTYIKITIWQHVNKVSLQRFIAFKVGLWCIAVLHYWVKPMLGSA